MACSSKSVLLQTELMQGASEICATWMTLGNCSGGCKRQRCEKGLLRDLVCVVMGASLLMAESMSSILSSSPY